MQAGLTQRTSTAVILFSFSSGRHSAIEHYLLSSAAKQKSAAVPGRHGAIALPATNTPGVGGNYKMKPKYFLIASLSFILSKDYAQSKIDTSDIIYQPVENDFLNKKFNKATFGVDYFLQIAGLTTTGIFIK